MNKKASKKISGGKLLRVELEFDQVIKRIQISGDFFLHPEESLEEIEKALIGSSIENVKNKLDIIVNEKNIQLIGISTDDIAEVVEVAVNG